MNTVAKLTQKQIEKLAVEIRTFLLEHDMWVDTQIYFNGKCFERTILSKVAELNGISICDERTVKIELTEAEIEEAYRIREREYLEEDIKNAVEEFCDYWGIPKGIAGGLNDNPDIICKIASLYEKNQDTNVASADTMKEAVKQVLKKEGVWK